MWDARDGRLLRTLSGHGGAVTTLAFSPDTGRLAVGCAHGSTVLHGLGPRRERRVFRGRAAAVVGVAFSADGTRLFTTAEDSLLRVFEVPSGRRLLLVPLEAVPGPPAVEGAGQLLAAGADERLLLLRRVPRLEEPSEPATPPAGPTVYFPALPIDGRSDARSLTMSVHPGRRVDLWVPADGGGSSPDPAAVRGLLAGLDASADLIDLLLDSSDASATGPRPRVVALRPEHAQRARTALGSEDGIESRKLLGDGLLGTAAATGAAASVIEPHLLDDLATNAFLLGPTFCEFRSGVAVFLRERCLDRLGLRPSPGSVHLPAGLEAAYAASGVSFLDALTRRGAFPVDGEHLPGVPGSSRRHLVASLLLHLHAHAGGGEPGDAWAQRFFRLLAAAPPTPGDTPAGALAQAHLWRTAASTAANEDLTDLFEDRWRLPTPTGAPVR